MKINLGCWIKSSNFRTKYEITLINAERKLFNDKTISGMFDEEIISFSKQINISWIFFKQKISLFKISLNISERFKLSNTRSLRYIVVITKIHKWNFEFSCKKVWEKMKNFVTKFIQKIEKIVRLKLLFDSSRYLDPLLRYKGSKYP